MLIAKQCITARHTTAYVYGVNNYTRVRWLVPRHQSGSTKQRRCPSVRLFHAPSSKTVRFRATVTNKTRIGSPVLKLESIGQRGRAATGSGQNVLEAEKLTSAISRKLSEIEPWLLLNVNRKS